MNDYDREEMEFWEDYDHTMMAQNYNSKKGVQDMSGRNGNRNSGGGDGCVGLMILGIVALPLVGLYLLAKKDADIGTRVLGGVLFIVGSVIWIYIGTYKGR